MEIQIDLDKKKNTKEVTHTILKTLNDVFRDGGEPFPKLWEKPTFGDGFIDDMFFLSLDNVKNKYGNDYKFLFQNVSEFKNSEPSEYKKMLEILEDTKKQLIEYAQVSLDYSIE